MERVKLMGWCSSCVTGMHMPAFAAAEAGLFADQGIEVEFVGCAKARDYTLSGFTTRPKAIASGYADVALSSVLYLLAAQNELDGRLPVRFVAISHQRNPIVAIVRAGSDLLRPEDLPGRRAARWSIPYYVDEYAGALAYMGLGAPEIVDRSEKIDDALASGEIDVMPTWMEMTQYHDRPELPPVRTIALDIDVYTTGMIAADRMPLDLVTRVRDCFAAGYDLFREQPELGVAGYMRQYPDISEEHIRRNWALHEPYVFGTVPVGAMDADRWHTTIAHTAETHGLSAIDDELIYRPQLVTPALSQAAA